MLRADRHHADLLGSEHGEDVPHRGLRRDGGEHTARDTWDGRPGDLIIIPSAPHALEALESSVVLLTAVMTG